MLLSHFTGRPIVWEHIWRSFWDYWYSIWAGTRQHQPFEWPHGACCPSAWTDLFIMDNVDGTCYTPHQACPLWTGLLLWSAPSAQTAQPLLSKYIGKKMVSDIKIEISLRGIKHVSGGLGCLVGHTRISSLWPRGEHMNVCPSSGDPGCLLAAGDVWAWPWRSELSSRRWHIDGANIVLDPEQNWIYIEQWMYDTNKTSNAVPLRSVGIKYICYMDFKPRTTNRQMFSRRCCYR